MKFSWIFIIGVCWFASCTPNPDRLKQALEFAGENRGELQKVLRHYEDDTLKSRACSFPDRKHDALLYLPTRRRHGQCKACAAGSYLGMFGAKGQGPDEFSILPAFIIMVTGWTVTTLCVGK